MNHERPARPARQAKQTMQTTNLDIRELVFERLNPAVRPARTGNRACLGRGICPGAQEIPRARRYGAPSTASPRPISIAAGRASPNWLRPAATPTHNTPLCRQRAFDDRRQLVAQTLRSKLGQQALKAGYGHSVRLFVEDHGRAPNAVQSQQMAAASKRAQRMAEKEPVAGTGATARLKAMWHAMGRREDALRREYLV